MEVIFEPRKPNAEIVLREVGSETVLIVFPLIVKQLPPIAVAKAHWAMFVIPVGTSTVPTQ